MWSPERPTAAVLSREALRFNIRHLKRLAAPARLMAVVKANAYGHGAVEVSRILHEEGVTDLAVATVWEAIVLRDAGIGGRILVFGAPPTEALPAYLRYGLDLAVSNPEVAEAVLREAGAGWRIHVKVDTGMHRIGMHPEEALSWVPRLAAAGVHVEGIWTHYATSDAFMTEQRQRFDPLGGILPEIPRHVTNTGALFTPGHRFSGEQWIRSGIALYGLAFDGGMETVARVGVQPVMALRTRITEVRRIEAGETVSYGRRWTASEPTWVATLGAGYADGYHRLLTGRSWVGVGGQAYPTAGTVCMDMTMFSAGSALEACPVRRGEVATLWGPGGPTTEQVAKWAETIPYELVCAVAARVERVWVDQHEESHG